MINSHYVPQLILRHFSDGEKIQYCDIDKRTLETRNIKSVFSEKGYYPEQLEESLCRNVEGQFANLLNKKILKERYKVVLSPEELFLLKKYLIVTTIRYNVAEAMKNSNNSERAIESYSKHFISNINKVLECMDLNQMHKLVTEIIEEDPILIMQKAGDMSQYGEIELFSDITNVIDAYVVLVSTNRSKEDIIIPDTGFSYRASHIEPISFGRFDKCFYTLRYALLTRNPRLLQVTKKLSPYDFILVPVSKDRAIILFSIFYKFFNEKSDIYGLLPVNGISIESLLGFGNPDLVEPPKVKQAYGKAISYEYSIKELYLNDILQINSSLINTVEHHFGYYSYGRIKRSIKYYNSIPSNMRRYDLEFLASEEE